MEQCWVWSTDCNCLTEGIETVFKALIFTPSPSPMVNSFFTSATFCSSVMSGFIHSTVHSSSGSPSSKSSRGFASQSSYLTPPIRRQRNFSCSWADVISKLGRSTRAFAFICLRSHFAKQGYARMSGFSKNNAERSLNGFLHAEHAQVEEQPAPFLLHLQRVVLQSPMQLQLMSAAVSGCSRLRCWRLVCCS